MPDKRIALAQAIRRVHERLRDACLAHCRQASMDDLASVADHSGGGDVTLGIDLHLERLLPGLLEAEVVPVASLAVLFEGQGDQLLVLPAGTPPQDAEFFSIWDPLDGSRTYAYQLRPAWILTGVSPNVRGRQPYLRD